MDKNTITGLLLLALVFFGFMWLSPKDDGSADTAKQEQQSSSRDTAAATTEPLSATEREWLVKNIAENGVAARQPDSTYIYTLDNKEMNLSVAGDSIWGTVNVDGVKVPWQEMQGAPKTVTVQQQAKAIETVRNASVSIGKYGKFAQFLHGKDEKVTLENDVLALQISSKSGSITRAELKNYTTEYSKDENAKSAPRNVVLFEGNSNSLEFMIPTAQPVSTSELYFTPTRVNDSTVMMTVSPAEGAWWGIEYTLPRGENYVVKMRIVQHGMAAVAQSNNRSMAVNWRQDVCRQEKGRMFEERNSGLYYKPAGGGVDNLSESSDDSEEKQAKLRWIGFKNQFFSSVLVSDRPFNTADLSSKVLKGSDYLKTLDAQAVVNDYDWNADVPASFSLFLGPNLYPLLDSLDDSMVADEDLELTKLIPLGWNIFRWINTLVIIPLFNFFGSFGWNYGIIILLLTIFIKLVLFPLTYKSYKSQAKMRILAPDIKAINEKYPGNENAMTRQQKTMALYSKAGASPFSGCLPMLLQMPILFAMFSFFPSCIELRGESFLWAADLSAPDAIISWSAHIPIVSEYFGNHISLFCLLMTATNIIYTYLNMQNSAGSMPGMKWMMYLMPVFFMIFFNNYAAGLSYYYFLSLLITICQTYAFRFFIKEEDVRKAMAENSKKPKKKSGFMARLEEMQRQQQQMLKEQQKRNNNSKGRH